MYAEPVAGIGQTILVNGQQGRWTFAAEEVVKRGPPVAVQSVRSVERGATPDFQLIDAAQLRVGGQDDAVQKALLLRRQSPARRAQAA